MENPNIRKEISVSELTVSKVYKSDFQKEKTLTAELRQIVTTKSFYPTKVVSNSLNESIFGMSDFGFEEKPPYENKETRVAWIDVPLNSTLKSVKAQLKKMPNATLYRILSNRPIIADTEQYAIENDELEGVTLDSFANKQVVRIPKGSENGGALALINGKVQYRRIAFNKGKKEDEDVRNSNPADYYASPELVAEMEGRTYIPKNQEL